MPIGWKFLSIQKQNDTITLWAEVEPGNDTRLDLFRIYGTGHQITHDEARYLGTVQMDNGLVWHVYYA